MRSGYLDRVETELCGDKVGQIQISMKYFTEDLGFSVDMD